MSNIVEIVSETHEETESTIIITSGRPKHYLLITEGVSSGGYYHEIKYIHEDKLKDKYKE